jgi:hypothetical protein
VTNIFTWTGVGAGWSSAQAGMRVVILTSAMATIAKKKGHFMCVCLRLNISLIFHLERQRLVDV